MSFSLASFLLVLLGLATGIQAIYWGIIFTRLHRDTDLQPRTVSADKQPPVSVVICAKNEAEQLAAFLPQVLEQQYSSFEVIVVNDNSTDDSWAILHRLKADYPHLIPIQYSDTAKVGKKKVLAKGIAHAQHNILLLTDADCVPKSSSWLAQMVAPFEQSKVEIVLGYSPYKHNRSFLNQCIQYETTLTALLYLSFALWGYPYMGVGRNLAYRKSLFTQHGGFLAHEHIASGDDDLFIASAATAQNTTIVFHPNASCISLPPLSWQAWYQQKKRHLSTGKYYAPEHQLRLGLFSGSYLVFYVVLILLLIFYPKLGVLLLFFYFFRLLLQFYVIISLSFYTKTPFLMLILPLLDLFYFSYLVFFSLFIFVNPTIQWKTNNQ